MSADQRFFPRRVALSLGVTSVYPIAGEPVFHNDLCV